MDKLLRKMIKQINTKNTNAAAVKRDMLMGKRFGTFSIGQTKVTKVEFMQRYPIDTYIHTFNTTT